MFSFTRSSILCPPPPYAHHGQNSGICWDCSCSRVSANYVQYPEIVLQSNPLPISQFVPTLINLSFLYWWVEDYFAKIIGVAWECVWIVEKPHQKHLSPPLCLVPTHWRSKSRLPLQNFLNPGYPPRFQRSQTVLGNSWDFRRQGFWATSSLQVWNVSSQLQGVAGCCWPQWPPWDVSYANKFVPVPGKDAFFLYKRSQSTDAGPKRRCRYLQDRLSKSAHPQCASSRSWRAGLTRRYLDVYLRLF